MKRGRGLKGRGYGEGASEELEGRSRERGGKN